MTRKSRALKFFRILVAAVLGLVISFFAKAWQEPTLIKLAYAFEQLTQVRKPPLFLQTADLGL